MTNMQKLTAIINGEGTRNEKLNAIVPMANKWTAGPAKKAALEYIYKFSARPKLWDRLRNTARRAPWAERFRRHMKQVAPNMAERMMYNVELTQSLRGDILTAEGIFVRTGLPSHLAGRQYPFSTVQETHSGWCQSAKAAYVPCEEVEKDWNVYSKGWHRAHGPKVTITRRYVAVYEDGAKVCEYDVPAWRGNWLANVVIRHEGIQPEWQRERKSVQLDPHYRVQADLTTYDLNDSSFRVYLRTLGTMHVDYAAIRRGVTFHADTKQGAIEGLAKKLSAETGDGRSINWEYARSLGFCATGLAQFCADNGLDANATYTVAEIRKAVVARRAHNCEVYGQELKKIGITLNCKKS